MPGVPKCQGIWCFSTPPKHGRIPSSNAEDGMGGAKRLISSLSPAIGDRGEIGGRPLASLAGFPGAADLEAGDALPILRKPGLAGGGIPAWGIAAGTGALSIFQAL